MKMVAFHKMASFLGECFN